MPFDYNKCIDKQIKIIRKVIGEAGNSGFSASCVGVGVIRETNDINSPFMIVKLEDLLYPQYEHPIKKVSDFILENRKWIKKTAKQNIKEAKKNKQKIHEEVMARWKELSK